MSKSFEGMVEVNATIVYNAALACICYIERKRNIIFKDTVDDLLNNPPIVRWYHDNYHWQFNRLFRSYPLVTNRKEAEQLERKYHRWYTPEWQSYKDKEYETSMDMINLMHNKIVYVSPDQGNIINKYYEGDYDDE